MISLLVQYVILPVLMWGKGGASSQCESGGIEQLGPVLAIQVVGEIGKTNMAGVVSGFRSVVRDSTSGVDSVLFFCCSIFGKMLEEALKGAPLFPRGIRQVPK